MQERLAFQTSFERGFCNGNRQFGEADGLKGKVMMSGTVPGWERDGIDPGWLYSTEIGSIRNAESYRPGGWYFLPQWLPDTAEHDVGPFPTRAAAIAIAEKMARQARRE